MHSISYSAISLSKISKLFLVLKMIMKLSSVINKSSLFFMNWQNATFLSSANLKGKDSTHSHLVVMWTSSGIFRLLSRWKSKLSTQKCNLASTCPPSSLLKTTQQKFLPNWRYWCRCRVPSWRSPACFKAISVEFRQIDLQYPNSIYRANRYQRAISIRGSFLK